MLLPEGQGLKMTTALRSGVPNAPLMCQLLRSKKWQMRAKLQSDAFELLETMSEEQKAF